MNPETTAGRAPPRARQSLTAAVILLAVPSFLWILALLYFLRVANLIGPLMKLVGGWTVYIAMVLCPLAAIFQATRARRKGFSAARTRWLIGFGSFLVLLFAVAIGYPLVTRAMQPATPKNPGTPRSIEPQTGLPVFPGAEGLGTRTRAGRGGKIIFVTSLADSGSGTLRAALADPNPRTIVFRVSGTIELQDLLFINHPFVSVAGQTAPGGGICIKNCGIAITTHDVLVQHIRIRPGNEGRIDADVNDAIQILGDRGKGDGAYNIVLDHISAGWSEDEVASTWFGAHDITISWSIISEALNRSRHRKRTHSAGVLIGDGSYHVSVHHSVMAHNSFRNPLIAGGGTHDIVNNVMYDWADTPAEIVDTDSNSFLNFVGNYFRPGRSQHAVPYDIVINSESGMPQIYVEGNIGIRRPNTSVDEWSLVVFGWGGQLANEKYRARSRFPTPSVTTWSASEALDRVLGGAGATRPRRDSVDERVLADVKNGSGRIIDSPQQVGGYPTLASSAPPIDSDRDGLPDDWEKENGLNAHDASDSTMDQDGDGYTNIEEYLHALAK